MCHLLYLIRWKMLLFAINTCWTCGRCTWFSINRRAMGQAKVHLKRLSKKFEWQIRSCLAAVNIENFKLPPLQLTSKSEKNLFREIFFHLKLGPVVLTSVLSSSSSSSSSATFAGAELLFHLRIIFISFFASLQLHSKTNFTATIRLQTNILCLVFWPTLMNSCVIRCGHVVVV